MPRWPNMDPSRRCAAHKPDGSQCQRARKPGTTVCEAHGAKAGHVKAAAQRRVEAQRVAELAERLDIEVPEFASAVDAARYVVGRITRRAAQFGALADQHGNDAIYADRAGQERIRAAFTGEQRWLGELAKVLAVAAQADAARQRTSADHEAMIDRIADAMVYAVTDGLLEYREQIPARLIAEIAEKTQQHLGARLRKALLERLPEHERSRYTA